MTFERRKSQQKTTSVFLSRDLIVAPWKFDVLKLTKFPLEDCRSLRHIQRYHQFCNLADEPAILNYVADRRSFCFVCNNLVQIPFSVLMQNEYVLR